MLSSDGVLHADANGCGFKAETPELTGKVVDFVPHPSEPMKMFGVVSNPGGLSGLVLRSPDGTWAEIGVKDALSPVSLKVAARPSGVRIYQAAVKPAAADAGSTAEYVVRASDDMGQSWQDSPLVVDSGTRHEERHVDDARLVHGSHGRRDAAAPADGVVSGAVFGLGRR